MNWLIKGPVGCFDTETTGVDVETDRLVTACVGGLHPRHQPCDEPGMPWTSDTHVWLIDPGVDIPEQATAVHGITTAHAKENGEDPGGALDIIAHDLARLFLARIPVVACNAVFDFTILDRELRRHDRPTLPERLGFPIGPIVDVYVLDKWIEPYRKGGRKLTDLCARYGVRIDGAHDATADALAAARVAYRIALLARPGGASAEYMYVNARKTDEIMARLDQLAHLSASQLHTAQVGWRREQCDSLRAYFDRKGTAHDGMPGDWPMIPWTTATDEAVPHGQ